MKNFDEMPYELATPQHRFGGRALDWAFLAVTFWFGWIVWSLVVWGQGQTPGHQVVKMRIYSLDTRKPTSWGHTALRQLVLPLAFSFVAVVPGAALTVIPNRYFEVIGMVLIYIGIFGVFLADTLWIFRGNGRQRLVDVFAKTVVLNECSPRKLDSEMK